MSQIEMKIVELGELDMVVDVIIEKPCETCMEVSGFMGNRQQLVTFVKHNEVLVGMTLECVECNAMHGYWFKPMEQVYYDMELVIDDKYIGHWDGIAKMCVMESKP